MHAVFRAADGDDLLNAQMAHDAGGFGGFEIKPLHPARKDRRRLDQYRHVMAALALACRAAMNLVSLVSSPGLSPCGPGRKNRPCNLSCTCGQWKPPARNRPPRPLDAIEIEASPVISRPDG